MFIYLFFQVVAGDPYEVRIAGMETWKAVDATATKGVTATILPSEAGWLRLRLESRKTQAVKWILTCKAGQGYM